MSELQYESAVINVVKGTVGPDKATTIPVKFNPTEYSLEKSVTYADQSLPGFTSPVTQFVSGEAETLSMELFFDTYENEKGKQDVRKQYTNLIDDLLKVDGTIHSPPVCEFQWGDDFKFKGVLQSANKRFTMFLPSGIPVRARVDVTFKEYNPPGWQLKEEKRESSDRTKLYRVTEGESLWSIAGAEYGDPQRWRVIAEENEIENPRTLQPGQELELPTVEG